MINIEITQEAIKYVAESAEIEIKDAQAILKGAISLCKFPSDVELRNEAVEVGQTCPSCSGLGFYSVGNFDETCSWCEGTGHV